MKNYFKTMEEIIQGLLTYAGILFFIIIFIKMIGAVYIKFFTIKRGDPRFDWGDSQIPKSKNIPAPPKRGSEIKINKNNYEK